jgi:hypothetical protein
VAAINATTADPGAIERRIDLPILPTGLTMPRDGGDPLPAKPVGPAPPKPRPPSHAASADDERPTATIAVNAAADARAWPVRSMKLV